ncbi:MAG TPA: class I SAM-dependent methyltransferase [Gaiellaceae bacterium]|nr:class I SAM-dependent methyltransferase [Gaiellaceae bacterium]
MTFAVAAEEYDRFVGRYSGELGSALASAAGVLPGMRALDVGCGPGALTRVLADRLGPENVAAVDPSEPFLEAVAARLPGVDVRLARAEELPFEDGAFDAALAQLVVNFMADPHAGVAEMRRVVRPGGTVAACVWDYAEEMTLLRAFWEAAAALEPERVEGRDERTAMRFDDEGELAGLWREAGLGDVEEGRLVVSAGYESFEDLWAPLESGVGPAGAYTASLDAERRRALAAELRRRLGEPEGPFRLSARAWYTAGTA